MWPMIFFLKNLMVFIKSFTLYFDNEMNKFDNKTFWN